jgi:hypothetical protein
MKASFKRFVVQILVLTGILLALWSVLLFTLRPGILSPAIPFMIVFFLFITSGIYYIMLQSAANRFPRFVNSYMVVTLGKILLFSVLIVIYALANRSDAVPFITAFFLLYLIYTVFELSAFLRDLKQMERK